MYVGFGFIETNKDFFLQGENSTEKEDKHRHGTIHAKYK
jgi:hypothetical protein